MVRQHAPVPAALRNRNRITNKSRLKILHGNVEADPLIPDEDEEKNRLLQSVAGVDQEDANEHHLQQVLSEAASRNHAAPARRPGHGGASAGGGATSPDKSAAAAASTAFIPTPDSTGTVDNHEELYPPNRWKDPHTYLYSSYTVEESCDAALASGFTYFMDERDMDWLEKNNEEARGEGTSAQGAVSSTRHSSRSANKAKGKEPEQPAQATVISEDEFELVMGLYEKWTHEKTEFLHHGLEQGMAFPAFAEYSDQFSNALPPATFACFSAPTWMPTPAKLARIARAVYPHWKERRIERDGHRIIPTLNADEADTLNESYVCFRRRDVKAARKTRASQASSSEKLARLQAELEYPLQLAQKLLERETLKRDSAANAAHVWEKRQQMVDLRRKNPSLFEKGDEELLVDKERPVRKTDSSRANGIKLTSGHSLRRQTAQPADYAIRPREHLARIQIETENELARTKERDRDWDDFADLPYQPPMAPYASKLFKYFSPSSVSESRRSTSPPPRSARPARLRLGRGGRLHIDRRFSEAPMVIRRRLHNDSSEDEDIADAWEADRRERDEARWRFDPDDGPMTGPLGADEQDRMLVDEHDTKYIRHTISLFADGDLQTDPSIVRYNADKKEIVTPFRMGSSGGMVRRDPAPRYPAQAMISQSAQAAQQAQAQAIMAANGQPISISQLKTAQQQQLLQQQQQHMRISGTRQMPVSATSASPPTTTQQPQQHQGSPPNSAAGLGRQNSPPNPNTIMPNGVRPVTSLPDASAQQQQAFAAAPNGNHAVTAVTQQDGVSHDAQPVAFQRPKQEPQQVPVQHSQQAVVQQQSQQGQQPQVNGFHGYNAQYLPQTNTTSSLSVQQMQNLKNVFAAQSGDAGRAAAAAAAFAIPNSVNMNLKLPPGRQWPATQHPQPQVQRPVSAVDNGAAGGQMVNGSHGPSMSPPSMNGVLPMRSPSRVQQMRPGVPQTSPRLQPAQGGY